MIPASDWSGLGRLVEVWAALCLAGGVVLGVMTAAIVRRWWGLLTIPLWTLAVMAFLFAYLRFVQYR